MCDSSLREFIRKARQDAARMREADNPVFAETAKLVDGLCAALERRLDEAESA